MKDSDLSLKQVDAADNRAADTSDQNSTDASNTAVEAEVKRNSQAGRIAAMILIFVLGIAAGILIRHVYQSYREEKLSAIKELSAEEKRIAGLLAPLREKGVEFSEDGKTLIKCPASLSGNIIIPSCVTAIGDYAFAECRLTSVTIPDSVTTIGKGAFSGCRKLTSVMIPESVTTIGDWTFNECSNLISVEIPESVTTIGDWTFNECSNLISVEIPESVTAIGDLTFNECSNLTSVTIPGSVTTIGDLAFFGCKKLTSVMIPDSVATVGNGAFAEVKSVKVSSENRHFKLDSAGALLSMDGKKIFYFPSVFSGKYNIPDGVITIGELAFFNCRSLTSITIPDSVTSIGAGGFDGCTNLTLITIPDSVTSIGAGAFRRCENLTSIAIPGNCKVADNAFPANSKVIRK